MQEKLTLSIIIPVYNAETTLAESVRSLLDQGLAEGSYEIILVNDCSTDGTAAICGSFAAEYPWIKVVDQPENRGVGEARNAGMERAGASTSVLSMPMTSLSRVAWPD